MLFYHYINNTLIYNKTILRISICGKFQDRNFILKRKLSDVEDCLQIVIFVNQDLDLETQKKKITVNVISENTSYILYQIGSSLCAWQALQASD